MAWLRSREVVDRLLALASRMAGGSATDDAEVALRRIEDAHLAVGAARDAAEARVAQLELALSHVDQGLVLADASGAVVYRNSTAEHYANARHGAALVERTTTLLLERGLRGEEGSETVELYGPPRQSVVVSSTPLTGPDEAVAGVLVCIEDVSDRRRVERMRRDFVANISHELKTPVGALGLLSDVLAGATEPSEVQRLAERVQLEATRLARTVEELLDLSRIETDESPARDVVEVRGLVDDALERTRTTAEHAGVLLDVGPVTDDVSVVGDRQQLVSALQNLLDNAVKYSDSGDRVVVSVAVAGGQVEIAVSDDGIGIPTRDLERIFERFYRVDRARARATGGTGLGLSIVRHVAQNHGGEVLVSSREGEGSRFTLRLPIDDAGDVEVPRG